MILVHSITKVNKQVFTGDILKLTIDFGLNLGIDKNNFKSIKVESIDIYSDAEIETIYRYVYLKKDGKLDSDYKIALKLKGQPISAIFKNAKTIKDLSPKQLGKYFNSIEEYFNNNG